ncbi:hypothetical protein [Anaeroselena agilis]|uniref:Uncharacterized protein n=1 Tax=Anaeroselena agilis TaxID=3063788 RepID=A0ABU3NWF3_9FIRM|nr:hypothetical protein [Selenomonadales bacterium 4137-cl]
MIKRICGTCLHYSPKYPNELDCHNQRCITRIDRPEWKPRAITCTICDTAMIYYDHEYFECPDCGSQFWPFVEAISTKKVVRQEFEKGLECARSMEVGNPAIHVKSKVCGGSKSKRKKNKNVLQKKPTSAIYNELCASKAKKS